MEQRDGFIEFRVAETPVYDRHGNVKKTLEETQYRQCFKGIWTPWQDMPKAKGK